MILTRHRHVGLAMMLLVMFSLVAAVKFYGSHGDQKEGMRIAYFHGGRAVGIYRTYVYDANIHLLPGGGKQGTNYFEQEDVDVTLYSQNMLEEGWSETPKTHEGLLAKYRNERYGKVSGVRIIEAIEEGVVEGGTPGGASFLLKVAEGSPVVAIARLGHDTTETPGKALVLRDGLLIETPEDFKGKRFGSRRAGPGDRIFLSEFFVSIGLDPETDVTIVDQIPDHLQIPMLRSKQIDGSLVHFQKVDKAVKQGAGYLYRRMDWLNGEISQALLVVRKDVIERRREDVEKVVLALVKRLAYEQQAPEDERIPFEHPGDLLGLEWRPRSSGGAVYDYPPLVRVEFLEELQELLLKYRVIDKKVALDDFIDNSFVEKAMQVNEEASGLSVINGSTQEPVN